MSQILYIPRIGQRASFNHPINRGLLGWWPLDEGSTSSVRNIANETRGKYNGVLDSGVSWEQTSLGNASYFDGSKNEITLSNFSPDNIGLTGTKNFTSCAWFKYINESSLNSNGYIFTNANAGTISWRVIKTSGNMDFFLNYFGSPAYNANLSLGLTEQVWYFGCMTYDGEYVRFYIDGIKVLEDSYTQTLNARTSSIFQVGGTGDSTRPFAGNIQNMRFFNRTLYQNEITELYTNPWVGLQPLTTSTRYFYFPPRPLSETIGTFKMRNLSFTPKSGGRTIIRKPS